MIYIFSDQEASNSIGLEAFLIRHQPEQFSLILRSNNISNSDQIKVEVQILSLTPTPVGEKINWDLKETYGGAYPPIIVNFRQLGASEREFYTLVKKLKVKIYEFLVTPVSDKITA